tara:strand:+ start:2739 stop:2945 length:207 start_codon:yes stop_codon:yes gene_type:complete
MSRYKPLLTKEHIRFIIDNPEMTNIDLAEKFKVETNIIAQYKSRLRKIGVKLPLLKRTSLIADAVNDK